MDSNKYGKEWLKDKFLHKTFDFNNFVEAVSFINQIVPEAETMNHHPDIEIFSYKKVKIKLLSHDIRKITDRDYELAKKIDKIFELMFA